MLARPRTNTAYTRRMHASLAVDSLHSRFASGRGLACAGRGGACVIEGGIRNLLLIILITIIIYSIIQCQLFQHVSPASGFAHSGCRDLTYLSRTYETSLFPVLAPDPACLVALHRRSPRSGRNRGRSRRRLRKPCRPEAGRGACAVRGGGGKLGERHRRSRDRRQTGAELV